MGTHQRPPRKPAPTGRQPDSCLLIGTPDVSVCRADDDLMLGDLEKRYIPMPRGRGYRCLVKCPTCGKWAKDLFQPAALIGDPRYFRCRACWHLKYPSQYYGRRPACDPARMLALLDAAVRAHKRGNEELAHRRAQRFFAAMDTYEERLAEYQMAELEREWALLQSDLARIDRLEAKAKRGRRRKRRPPS